MSGPRQDGSRQSRKKTCDVVGRCLDKRSLLALAIAMGAPGAFTSESQTPLPVYTPKLRAVLRRLDALVDWERRLRGGAGPGAMRRQRTSAQPARVLLSRLGDAHASLRAVHVTGSKGKGSVAALVTAALLRAPFLPSVVGTYGSPHVERVNERIRLNARPAPDDDFAAALTRALDARERAPVLEDATWFDVMTAAGIDAFRRAHARWAVVEVGMGGRLDSTNVLAAPVAVVTNVHLEHAEIIGPTLRDIAYEKAGIIAADADVVVGMDAGDDLSQVFLDEAAAKSPPARVRFFPRRAGATIFEHNLEMARAAMQAVARIEGAEAVSGAELLPRDVAAEALGMLPARQEVFQAALSEDWAETSVRVLLDGAHVPDSVGLVLEERGAGHGGSRAPVVLLGVGREKDVAGICRVVHSFCPEHIIASVTGPESPYLPAAELGECLRQTGDTPVSVVGEAEQALVDALQLASKKETDVVVLGSLHFAGKIRPELRRRQKVCSRHVEDSQRGRAASFVVDG